LQRRRNIQINKIEVANLRRPNTASCAMEDGIRLEAGDRTRKGWRIGHIHELQGYIAMSRKQIRIQPPHQDQELRVEVFRR